MVETWANKVYGVETETISKLDEKTCIDFTIENNKKLKEKVEKEIEQYPLFDRKDIEREIIEDFYNGIYSSDDNDNIYAGICEDIERTLNLTNTTTPYMYIEHNEEGDIILGLVPVFPHLEKHNEIEILIGLTKEDIDKAFKETFAKLGVKLSEKDIDVWTITNWS